MQERIGTAMRKWYKIFFVFYVIYFSMVFTNNFLSSDMNPVGVTHFYLTNDFIQLIMLGVPVIALKRLSDWLLDNQSSAIR